MGDIGAYSRIHVRVHCTAALGQAVAITGLGVTKFQKLVTTPQSYPIWTTINPIIVPRGLEASYRYALLESGVQKLQEPLAKIRKIIPDEDDVVLEDHFDVSTVIETKAESKLKDSYRSMSENDSDASWNAFVASKGRLFLVCYHLPVVIRRTSDAAAPFDINWAESLIAKTAGSVSSTLETIWIGTISVAEADLNPAEKEYLLAKLKEMSCVPIFLDTAVSSAAYYGFCKGVMWPIFHNVDQLDQIHAAWNLPTEADIQRTVGSLLRAEGPRSRTGSNVSELFHHHSASSSHALTPPVVSASVSSATLTMIEQNNVLAWNRKEQDFLEAYRSVNEAFARILVPMIRPSDVIWVHDYHLMLLPKIVRDECTKKSIDHLVRLIFFLHIPFPTSQIFRTLPEATELLQSMVNADLVGFHAFDHARHFLNAAKRILGVKSTTRQGGMITLTVHEREVVVTMSHVSIETDRFDAVLRDPETHALAERLKAQYRGRQVILGIDVGQRLSGIALKVAGFEKLLSEYHSGDKVGAVLVQRTIRQGSRPEDEETTSNDVKKMVADINLKYSPRASQSPVVDYEEIGNFRGLSLRERVALYLIADVFLLTPIREGLNLMPLEYIYVRRDLPRAGVVIVSEFSTCSSLLNGSLKVNPFSSASIADSLEKALCMSARDCEYRRQRDLPFISSHPSSLWTKEILGELAHLKITQEQAAIADGDLAATAAQSQVMKRHHHRPTSESGSNPNSPQRGGAMNARMSFRFASSSSASAHSRAQFLTADMLYTAYHSVDSDDLNECLLSSAADTEKKAPTSAVPSPLIARGHRVFVFDYGGVLLHKERFDIYLKQTLSAISGRRPTQTMLQCLQRLCADPLNIVVVVTGLTKLKLGDVFADKAFENLTLATSNGLVYSWGKNLQQAGAHSHGDVSSSPLPLPPPPPPTTTTSPLSSSKHGTKTSATAALGSSSSTDRAWECLDFAIDWGAVGEIAVPIITKFTFRTNGTCQTPRFPGIGWSYFGADPDWGGKQAEQLTIELEAALARFDVKITSLIPGSIEVVPRTLNKSLLLKQVYERVLSQRAGKLPHLIVVMGAEGDSDSGIFDATRDLLREAPASAMLHQCCCVTVSVGKRDKRARYFLRDVQDVEELLQHLTDTGVVSNPLTPRD